MRPNFRHFHKDSGLSRDNYINLYKDSGSLQKLGLLCLLSFILNDMVGDSFISTPVRELAIPALSQCFQAFEILMTERRLDRLTLAAHLCLLSEVKRFLADCRRENTPPPRPNPGASPHFTPYPGTLSFHPETNLCF